MKKIFTKLAITVISAVAVTFSFNAAAIAASPGALDPSFGIGGKVSTDIFGNDSVGDVAVQSDGKIIVVGGSGINDFTIARYTANGVLDTTFSGDGILFTDFGGTNDVAGDVELQSDGKIIVSGNLGGSGGSAGIARYLPNGNLDVSFDSDGKLIIANFRANGLAIQSDGKIVLAGRDTLAANPDAVVIRLNLDGTSDTTFDADGRVTTNIETSDSLAEVKLQTDGKIVAAGNAAGSAKSVVIRYNTNGSLDTTFSGDGIALNDFSVEGEPTSSLAIDSISGSIITVGSNFLGQDTSLIIRYILNGTLDTSFSGDGRLEPVLNSSAGGEDVVIQSDRKIIILSNLGAGTVIDDISLIRLNTNGDFDTTFGNDGFVFTDIDGGNIQKLALVGDKLLVVNNANSFQDFGLERYNLSKTPSQTGDFDGDGFTDSTVYRPSTATWFTLRSADNTVTQEQFGLNGDIPMDGDFDGDGRADLAIFRPSSGIWFFKRSSNGTTLGAQFGATGDKPQAGDFDKDGKSDIGLWRPSNGNWFVLRSSSNFTNFFGYAFGANGDIPVQTGAQ